MPPVPDKTIKLHVSANNAVIGVLNVKVTPWRVRVRPGEVVEWKLDTNGPANNDILWFRVERIDRKPWPFDLEPPHPSYTGLDSNTVISPPRNNANPVNAVIAYGLTIGFKDDAGDLRTMYIDPDMIIDV
jgi:hypothetical protein